MIKINQSKPCMGEIQIPQFKMIPLSKLVWPNLNRGEDIQHVKDLKDSIDEEGFMGAIRVFPKNVDGQYQVVDSNHTTKALKTMFNSNPDMEAPCLVIWWKDESDVEEVQAAIMTLNLGNKEWMLYDFVKSHSSPELKHRKNYRIMCEIRDNMRTLLSQSKKNKGGISNGVVASMYTKDSRNHKLLRKGSFELDARDRPYVDYFLNNYPSFVWRTGGKKFKAPFNRRFIHRMWQSAETMNDFQEWTLFFDYFCDTLSRDLARQITLPDGDEVFHNYFEEVEKAYLNK